MEYLIRSVTLAEAPAAMSIYDSLRSRPGCVWSDDYPAMEHVEHDVLQNALHGMYADGRLVGVAAASKDEELLTLPCWNPAIQNPCELSRVGVLADYQRQGIAQRLLRHIQERAIAGGFDGMRLLVSPVNQSAIALYHGMGYERRGEARMYDLDWYCYEKAL